MARRTSQPVQVTGSLRAFNFSPKGTYEGLVLATESGVVQLNFPPEFAEELSTSLQEGSAVTARAILHEDGRSGSHSVYRLVSISLADGNVLAVDEPIETTGRVARLNYTKRGEVNGAVLENGDFVHLKPNGARQVSLAEGQELMIAGMANRLRIGQGRLIEAEIVNGMPLRTGKVGKPAAAKKAVKKVAAKKLASKRASAPF